MTGRRQFRLHNRSDEELQRLEEKTRSAARFAPTRRPAGYWSVRLGWALAGALAVLLIQRLL